MDTNQTGGASQLALQAAAGASQASPDAAAEKAAAEKAAAEKAAAEKAAAEKAARPQRARRGPPADGRDEDRVTVLMSTSKMSSATGRLRRGQAVSVPARRLEALITSGKVREATAAEIAGAERRYGLGRLA